MLILVVLLLLVGYCVLTSPPDADPETTQQYVANNMNDRADDVDFDF